jgi:hypothetical protein
VEQLLEGFWGNALVALATLVATIVGALLAWWLNDAAETRRAKSESDAEVRRAKSEEETKVLAALQYLTGGTQARSAGIGLLEGLLHNPADKMDPLRAVFLPVIRNQLIYLGTSSDPKNEVHEHDNFRRLVTLWTRLGPDEIDRAPLSKGLEMRKTIPHGLEFFKPYDADLKTLCDHVGLNAEGLFSPRERKPH